MHCSGNDSREKRDARPCVRTGGRDCWVTAWWRKVQHVIHPNTAASFAPGLDNADVAPSAQA